MPKEKKSKTKRVYSKDPKKRRRIPDDERETTLNRSSIFGRLVSQYARSILSGRLLAIDPSSGSTGSMPGFALYEKGQLISSGRIKIPLGQAPHRRMFHLGECLRSNFKDVDVLVVENLSTGFGVSTVLLQSVGAVYASVESPLCIPVSPRTWHMNAPEGYVKTDEGDAVLLGWTTIKAAAIVAKVDYEPLDLSTLTVKAS